jgi:copper(I)-binding protein
VKRSRFLRLILLAAGISLVAAGLAVVAACGGDDDESDDDDTAAATPAASVGNLDIFDPWVRVTNNDVTAGYFTVKNAGLEDTLVKATASISPMVQLHEVITEGASSKMQEKAGGFTVPAQGDLVLKPGSYHLMMLNLTAPVKEGETVEIELEFAKAGKVKFTAPVKTGAGMSPDGGGMHSGGTPTAGAN